MANIMPTIYS